MTVANTPRNARRLRAKTLFKYAGPGKVVFVKIRHDPQCMIYSNERFCTCEPVRELLDERGQALALVSGGGSFDPSEMTDLAAHTECKSKHPKAKAHEHYSNRGLR